MLPSAKNYLLNPTGIKWLPTAWFTWAKTIIQGYDENHHGKHTRWENCPAQLVGKQSVTKWWYGWLIWIRMFPQSWDQVVLCHGVDLQVHKAHHAGEHVNIHITWRWVLEEPHCHYGGIHWLIGLFCFLWRDTNNCPWTVFFPHASHDLCKASWRAWILVFWHWQPHHHFLGQSSRFIPPLSGSGLISTMGCH